MYFTKYPYLQVPLKDNITVMWETDEIASSELRVYETFFPDCGNSEGNAIYIPKGEPMVFIGNNGYIHKVKATGLSAKQDYCYQVISKTMISK